MQNKCSKLLGYILAATLFTSALAEQKQTSTEQTSQENRVEKALKFLEENQIRFLQLEFTDMHGNAKSYTITRMMAKSAFTEGIKFDGSSIPGYTTITDSDMLLIPDLSTLRTLPWTKGQYATAMVISDVHNPNGTPCENCPRIILKRALLKSLERGFDFVVSPELEFFLFKKGPVNKENLDGHDYCALANVDDTNYLKLSILNVLQVMGCKPEKAHHEVAQNQHEITMRYCSALQMADNLIIAKNVISTLAHLSGYEVSFLPKPFENMNGSGLHINYSLYDTKKQQNAFFDSNDANYLSSLAKKFIAGNLAHAQALSGLFNPTKNSFKRLVPGFEAPIFICWGTANRSALIRIPEISKTQGYAQRAEIRCPDPTCNPYLAFAALLTTGFEGIEHAHELMPETIESTYRMSTEQRVACNIATLPESLADAVDILSKDALLTDLLGKTLMNDYVTAKKAEAAGTATDH